MNKTAAEWLKELPKSIRQEAIKYIMEDKKYYTISYLSAAIACIEWGATPSGRDFWQALMVGYLPEDFEGIRGDVEISFRQINQKENNPKKPDSWFKKFALLRFRESIRE